MKLRPRLRCAAGYLSILVVVAAGFVSIAGSAAEEEAVVPEQAAHRARMKGIAESIRIYGTPDRNKAELPLLPEPVLRYADPTRKLFDSGLWVWGKGRPAAIVAIEFYPNSPRGPRWLYEIASLSPDRIAAARGADLDWTAAKPGLDLKVVPKTPAVADRPLARLTQIKQMQRRFQAHEVAPVGGRIELRALATPLHRYEDSAAGVLDGAIVSFANGTNPEILLILEADGKNGAPGTWRYGLAQMTGAKVSVEVDGTEVWHCDEADPPAKRDRYVNGWIAEDAP